MSSLNLLKCLHQQHVKILQTTAYPFQRKCAIWVAKIHPFLMHCAVATFSLAISTCFFAPFDPSFRSERGWAPFLKRNEKRCYGSKNLMKCTCLFCGLPLIASANNFNSVFISYYCTNWTGKQGPFHEL